MSQCLARLRLKDNSYPIYCRRGHGHYGEHKNAATGHEWSDARPDHAHITEVRERLAGRL